MKFTLSYSGDIYEDREDLRDAVRFREYSLCLSDLREAIRSRRKYHSISDDEDKFLQNLIDMICEVGHE